PSKKRKRSRWNQD
nr:Chain B, Splicing Factor SF1 [synthetic construct]1OPI_B Chain B, SPLICING FACTOR SF1 [synthetic construct]